MIAALIGETFFVMAILCDDARLTWRAPRKRPCGAGARPKPARDWLRGRDLHPRLRLMRPVSLLLLYPDMVSAADAINSPGPRGGGSHYRPPLFRALGVCLRRPCCGATPRYCLCPHHSTHRQKAATPSGYNRGAASIICGVAL